MADLKIFARTIEPEAMAQIEQMAAAPRCGGLQNPHHAGLPRWERLHHRHHHDHP